MSEISLSDTHYPLYNNAKALSQSGRNIPVPFRLELEGGAQELYCDNIARLLPGKRIVMMGMWQGKHVVAKIFFASRVARRHAAREYQGASALLSANILTPEMLYYGKAKGRGIYVIIYERIMPAQKLSAVWETTKNPQEKQDILKSLMMLLATHHRYGLHQYDLHMDNFIVSNRGIYTLDCSSIKVIFPARQLGYRSSLKNVGRLCAQLGIEDEKFITPAFRAYLQVRGWKNHDKFERLLNHYQLHWHHDRKRHFLKKIFRSSTKFDCHRDFFQYRVVDRDHLTPSMKNLLENCQDAFLDPSVTYLKKGNTCTVIKINIDNTDYVIKRYNIKHFFHGMKRSFQKTRAAISWRNAHYLKMLGVKTPEPVAMVEDRIGPLKRTAYYVMSYLPSENLADYFKNRHPLDSGAKNILQKVVHIIKVLSRFQLKHGDLKDTNFLVGHDGVALLDLDAMREYTSSLNYGFVHRKDIQRLLKNWEDKPEIIQFVKAGLSQS